MAPADPSHPATVDLERFMHGELKRREAREIVRHMLTGCPQCVAATRRLWNFAERSLSTLRAVSAAGSGEEVRSGCTAKRG